MKLLSYFKHLRLQAGFTMIELLIVIAILGILAIAVLAAINPIEQINRGRDTGSRSDAEQLISAIDRYYAFNGYYPWQTGAADTTNVAQAWSRFFDDSTLADANNCTVAEKLSTPGTGSTCTGSDELKKSFIERVSDLSYNYLYIYNTGDAGSSTYACFQPRSQAFVQVNTERLDPEGDGTYNNYPDDYPYTNAIGNTVQCGSSANCVCIP